MRLAVLGHPVAHSRSPAMHNAALRELHLSGTYRAIDAPDEASVAAIAGAVRRGEIHGVNITMPHKAAAHRLVDELDELAARAGSVNTWFMDGDTLRGASTDISGLATVCERRGIPSSLPVTVIGAGGAARAAAVAFSDRSVAVTSRKASAARALVEACAIQASVLQWGSAMEGSLVVNCTPLGMHGETLPPAVMESAAAVIDMAYGPVETPFIGFARANGLPHGDGIDVLAAQAGDSFSIWTGRPAPVEVMERAARNASSGVSAGPNQTRTPRQE